VNDDTKARLSKAGGQRLSLEDAARFRSAFPLPSLESLLDLQSALPLAGVNFKLGRELDTSGVGVNMDWMDPDMAIGEATGFTPGMQAAKLGLIAVGACTLGSGDPYFVDTRDARLPLVRIPHTAVNADTDVLDEGQIERVADSLDEFFERASFRTSG